MNTAVEDEIKTGLRGSAEAQFNAICQAYERFSDPLAAYLRERWAVTLDSSELTTAVNDVFIDLAKMAREGALHANGSLASLLFKMAQRKATDIWRQKSRHQKRYHADSLSFSEERSDFILDEIASRVTAHLKDAPEVAVIWKGLTQQRTSADQAASNEIVRQFKIWTATLPEGQRKVAETMAIYFGDITDEQICEELTNSEHPMPLGSVKSARKQIREKFQSLIKQYERIDPQ